jgi:hypothetical protein
MKTTPLVVRPPLEVGRVSDKKAIEKRTLIQGDGALQFQGCDAAFEFRDVARDQQRIQPEFRRADDEIIRGHIAPQRGKGLTQRIAGVLFIALWPQHRDDSGSAQSSLAGDREHGEQRERTTARCDSGDRAIRLDRESTKGPQVPHVRWPVGFQIGSLAIHEQLTPGGYCRSSRF